MTLDQIAAMTLDQVCDGSGSGSNGYVPQKTGGIELQQYASYLTALGNQLAFPIPNGGVWPNLTGADVHLWIAQKQAGIAIMPPVIDIANGVIQGSASAPTGVNFDVPSASTAQLTIFVPKGYLYCLVAYYGVGEQLPLTEWTDCTATPGKQLSS